AGPGRRRRDGLPRLVERPARHRQRGRRGCHGRDALPVRGRRPDGPGPGRHARTDRQGPDVRATGAGHLHTRLAGPQLRARPGPVRVEFVKSALPLKPAPTLAPTPAPAIERRSVAAESPRPRRATGRVPQAARSSRPKRTAAQLLDEARTKTAGWTVAELTAE